MPIGRFRKDPRELDDLEKSINALQYPESATLFGMGVGLIVPLGIQQFLVTLPSIAGTISTGFGPVVGGFVGYLLGHAYKQQRLERLRNKPDTDISKNQTMSASED